MALTTLPGDEKEKDKLNPGQTNYDRRFNDIAQAEEQGTFDSIANNYDQTANSDQEDGNIKKLQERESSGDEIAGSSFKSTFSGQKNKVKGKAWFTKKGPLFGIGGGFGIVGLIFAALTGNSFMLTGLMQNSFVHNDARGTILERRLTAALNQKMGNSSGPCDTTKASCRMGKMPKSMLAAMGEKKIVALNADGSKFAIEGNGYVDTNPASYEIDDGNGNKRVISAGEFTNEYKNNPVFRKSFKAAYNMRYLGYNGKYMANNFLKKYGLKRDGGLAADETLTESNANEKLGEKLTPNTSADSESGAKKTFKERFETLLKNSADKAKKSGGSPVLIAGAIGCTAINLPRFAAGTYRAIQAAQILVLLQDVVMSPGGMQKAGDGKASSIAAIGNLLTEKTKKSDGTIGKSALDSSIFQSAIGVNKNKVKPNKFTPGYGLITNPVVQASSSASAATKETCNLINSPQAALVAGGVEGAISAGTLGIGAIIIGIARGVGTVAIGIGAVDAAMQLANDSGVTDAVATAAYDAVKEGIGNYTDGARGEELGDALGMGMFAYFSQAGSVGGAAALTTSQVDGFSQAIASTDNEYRDEDIATLSPFDISSQYTFLGNIMSNLSLRTVQGDPIQTGFSMVGYLLGSPLSTLTRSVSAETSRAESECGNASEFGLEDDVAVNPAGYACVGLPPEALNMSRETAMNLVSADIDDKTGEPTEDGDITLMMNDCASGELESLSGCVIDGTDEKRAAESVYMFDYQVENILSGNDEEGKENGPASQVTTERPENTADRGNGWTLQDGVDYSSFACDPRTQDLGPYANPDTGATIRLCAVPFNAAGNADLTSGTSGNSSIVSSLISVNLMNMFEAAQAEGISMGISDGFRAAGGADYSTFSQHGRGLAVDLGVPRGGMTLCFSGGPSDSNAAACRSRSDASGDAVRWLDANAAKYGFQNLSSEPWHWSTGES